MKADIRTFFPAILALSLLAAGALPARAETWYFRLKSGTELTGELLKDSPTRVVVDLGGRAMLVYSVDTPVSFVRDFNIGLLREFFQGFANNAAANVHVKLEYGEEPHHVAEAVFKGFGRALDAACRIDARRQGALPSTKGLL